MKTIADFKRAMIIGSKWECTHRYISVDGHTVVITQVGFCELRYVQVK